VREEEIRTPKTHPARCGQFRYERGALVSYKKEIGWIISIKYTMQTAHLSRRTTKKGGRKGDLKKGQQGRHVTSYRKSDRILTGRKKRAL